MTGDETERAIDTLRGSVDNLETYIEQVDRKLGARIEETNAQIAETNRQLAETNKMLRIQGDTLSTFIEVTTSSFSKLASAQARTDERLNALINVVEKHISEGGHGQAP